MRARAIDVAFGAIRAMTGGREWRKGRSRAQRSGSIERVTARCPSLLTTRNSRARGPPNVASRLGPSASRSRKAAATPSPGIGAVTITTGRPVRLSTTGGESVASSSVSATQAWSR